MSSKSQNITPFSKAKTKSGSLLKYLALMVILALVVVAFVVTPALSSIGGGGNLDFGKFGNLAIRYNQGNYFHNQIRYQNSQARDNMSENSPTFESDRLDIWSKAYNETLIFTAKKYFMIESGFDVSTSALDRAVIESGYYTDDEGNFNSLAYQSSSAADRERIREALYDQRIYSMYENDVIGGLYRSEIQMDFLSDISPEERKVSYVAFSFSDYPDNLVREQGQLNSQYFQSRDVSRMTFQDEKAAQDALKALESGEQTFAEIAMERSIDFVAADGGLLGKRYYYELSDELGDETAQAIFALDVDGVSEPVESSYGWYIYKADGAIEDPDFSDEILIGKVRSWLNWNSPEVIDQWLNDQAEILAMDAQDRSWNMAVAAMNKNLMESDFFSLNWGGSPFVGSDLLSAARDSYLQSAMQSDLFFQTVFGMEIGEISEPIPMGNAVLLIRLEDVRENESTMPNFYAQQYLIYFRNEAWFQLIQQSELYTDNFIQAYLETMRLNES